jgi:Tol biopolymer transport system component
VAAAVRDAKGRTVLTRPEYRYYYVWAWSLDGKSILVTIINEDQKRLIAWVAVGDGTVTTLKTIEGDSGRVSLSPDGRHIAYDTLTGAGDDAREIRIMASDGTADAVLAPPPAISTSPIWTRDGREIFYVSNRSGAYSLWSTPVESGKPAGTARLVKSDVGNVNPIGFTATGSFLYSQLLGHLDVMTDDLDPVTGRVAGRPTRSVDTFVGSNLNPSWSPNGRMLAYISRLDRPAGQMGTLVIKSLDDGHDRSVGVFRGPYQPMWSADGDTILQAAKDAQNNIAVYQVAVKTGSVREMLSLGAGGPASSTVTTNGVTLFAALFRRPDGGGFTIAAFDLANNQRFPIDTGSSQVKSVAASPDGKTVAFVTHEYSPDRVAAKNAPQSRLHLANSDGSNVRVLFTVENPVASLYDIAWTPDSRFIYVRRNANKSFQLWRISAADGSAAFAGLTSSDVIGPFDVSRDGKRLLYGVGRNPSTEIWALENIGGAASDRW